MYFPNHFQVGQSNHVGALDYIFVLLIAPQFFLSANRVALWFVQRINSVWSPSCPSFNFMADVEQAEQAQPLTGGLNPEATPKVIFPVSICACCTLKCCCCCGSCLCLLLIAGIVSFLYTFGLSPDCGRPGDYPGAVCNPVSSPCNASSGWECRLFGGCVYGPAVGEMSTSQLSLYYRPQCGVLSNGSTSSWSETYSFEPARIEAPCDVAEVRQILLEAAEAKIQVKAVGGCASLEAIAVTKGVLLETFKLTSIEEEPRQLDAW